MGLSYKFKVTSSKFRASNFELATRNSSEKEFRRDKEKRQGRDGGGRQPRRGIINPAVQVRTHQFAVVDEPEYRDEQHGQKQPVDDLRDEQHVEEREARYHRHQPADHDEECEYAEEYRGLSETPRNSPLE